PTTWTPTKSPAAASTATTMYTLTVLLNVSYLRRKQSRPLRRAPTATVWLSRTDLSARLSDSVGVRPWVVRRIFRSGATGRLGAPADPWPSDCAGEQGRLDNHLEPAGRVVGSRASWFMVEAARALVERSRSCSPASCRRRS